MKTSFCRSAFHRGIRPFLAVVGLVLCSAQAQAQSIPEKTIYVDGVYMSIDEYRFRYGCDPALNETVASESGTGLNGGGGSADPDPYGTNDYIRILYREENGGAAITGGYVSGCAPQTLSVSVSHTKQTSWTLGAAYVVTVGYGVTESVTKADSSSYPVPTGMCGFLKATEILAVSGYDLYHNDVVAGSGIIIYLKGIKFNNGTL